MRYELNVTLEQRAIGSVGERWTLVRKWNRGPHHPKEQVVCEVLVKAGYTAGLGLEAGELEVNVPNEIHWKSNVRVRPVNGGVSWQAYKSTGGGVSIEVVDLGTLDTPAVRTLAAILGFVRPHEVWPPEED